MYELGKKIISSSIAVLAITVFVTAVAPMVSAETGFSMTRHHDSDTIDYCMKASDVSVKASEVRSMSRSALESDIIERSDFKFIIRKGWIPLNDGYSVDFSKLGTSPNTSGYPVAVTMPSISPGVVSEITFSVYIENDLAPVKYVFKSGTEGCTLPSGVVALLPAESSVTTGSIVTAPAMVTEYKVPDGIWKFSGWDEPSRSAPISGVTFTGIWTFERYAPAAPHRKYRPAEPHREYEPAEPVINTATIKKPHAPTAETATIAPVKRSCIAKTVKPAHSVSHPASGPEKSGNSSLKNILAAGIGASSAALAALLLSIFSDIRVLRWYRKKLLNKRR